MDIPRHWRLRKQRYALIGEECQHCDTKIFPPRDVCPCCKNEAKHEVAFSGKGEIYSFTTVHEGAPKGFENQTPYDVAMIKLEEGPLVTAQLTDFDNGQKPEIGLKVEMVTRKLREPGERDMLVYGYKFRPEGGLIRGKER